MRPWWRDVEARATAIFTATAVSGFVCLGLAWRGTKTLSAVPLQLPWVVSGGLGGAALIGTGIALVDIHLERRRAAGDRIALDRVVYEAEAFGERLLIVYATHRDA